MKKFFSFSSGFFTGAFSFALLVLFMIFLSTTSFEGIKKAGLLNSVKSFYNEMKNDEDINLPQSLKKEINYFVMNIDPKNYEKDLQNFPTTGNKNYWWKVPCDSSLTIKLVDFSSKKLLKKDGMSSYLSIWYDLNDNEINIMIYLLGSKGEKIFYSFPGDLQGRQKEEFISKADLKGFEERKKIKESEKKK